MNWKNFIGMAMIIFPSLVLVGLSFVAAYQKWGAISLIILVIPAWIIIAVVLATD
jgi:hypothetical protein